jgi:hypothetical protein
LFWGVVIDVLMLVVPSSSGLPDVTDEGSRTPRIGGNHSPSDTTSLSGRSGNSVAEHLLITVYSKA